MEFSTLTTDVSTKIDDVFKIYLRIWHLKIARIKRKLPCDETDNVQTRDQSSKGLKFSFGINELFL